MIIKTFTQEKYPEIFRILFIHISSTSLYFGSVKHTIDVVPVSKDYSAKEVNHYVWPTIYNCRYCRTRKTKHTLHNLFYVFIIYSHTFKMPCHFLINTTFLTIDFMLKILNTKISYLNLTKLMQKLNKTGSQYI